MLKFSAGLLRRNVLFLCFAVLFSQTHAIAREILSPPDQSYLDRVRQIRSKLDSRKMKTFILPNQLEVLMIQDPAAGKSAVALDVGVGSLSDPADSRGLAHYLEHMLFLGTSKYPKVGLFDDFLGKNGGDSNAYTSNEHTNYHLEVNSSAFLEALDQFAQFFIHPLFDPAFVERELKNIDSEYTKNLGNPGRRTNHLLNVLADPKHPQSRVFQGNLATLSKFSRQSLQSFYETYYSSNLMKLAIITPLPLESIEKSVRELFSEIPNRNVVAPKFSAHVERREDLPQLVQVKSVGEDHELRLNFSLPPYKTYSLSTPQTLISTLLNYEGDGSVAKFLKDEKLILAMGASPSPESFRSRLSVVFVLSKEGFQNWQKIVDVFFSYIQMLKSQDLNQQFFLDVQKTAELNHLFNTPATEMDGAMQFAKEMHLISPLLIEAIDDLEIRYSPESFRKILTRVAPERLQVVLSGPDVSTDKVEPMFQVPYSVSSLSSELISRWKTIRASSVFHYPKANRYLPQDVSFEGENQETPVEVRKDTLSHLWVQADHVFKKPKAILGFQISVPQSKERSQDILKGIFIRKVREGLTEWKAPVEEAGYRVQLKANTDGYDLTISGYSDKIELVAREAISKLTTFEMTKSEFEASLLNIAQNIRELETADPSGLAAKRLEDLLNPRNIPEAELMSLLSSLTYEQFRTFSRNAFQAVFIEGFGFGHIGSGTVIRVADHFLSTYNSIPMKAQDFAHGQRILLPAGKAFHNSLKAKNVDHAWLTTHQFGKTNPRRTASIELGNIFLRTPFYDEMRTVNSLGYIVSSYSQINALTSGYTFLIQSNQEPGRVTSLAEGWIQKRVQAMGEMSDEEFEKLKQGALEGYDHPPSSFEEKHDYFSTAVFNYGGDWDWQKKNASVLRSLSKAEVAGRWAKAFSPKTRRKLTINVFGDHGQEKWQAQSNEVEVQLASEFVGGLR